jgi:hypothetical protein
MSWVHVGTVILAAFLASLVEFVEALTIVLAVGTTRGWRSALIGAGAGALFLTGLTLAVGPALQRIPLTVLQLTVGVLLLLFGMRWLRKGELVGRPRGERPDLHDGAPRPPGDLGSDKRVIVVLLRRVHRGPGIEHRRPSLVIGCLGVVDVLLGHRALVQERL